MVSGSLEKLVALDELTTYLCTPIRAHPGRRSDSLNKAGVEVRTCPRAPRTNMPPASVPGVDMPMRAI